MGMFTVTKFTRRPLVAGAALAAALAAGTLAALAAQNGDPATRLETLEAGAAALAVSVDAMSQTLTGAPPVGTRTHVAQSREVAQINVRLDQLEEQMRMLTGQVEGLQFQLTQLQALIERLQQDYDLRFQDLEGGGPGKTEAAPSSGGATPSGAVSPPQATTTPDRLPAEPAPEAPATLESDTAGSLDPLLDEADNPEAGILGSLPPDLFDQPIGNADFSGDGLPAPGDRVGSADAEAQFNAAADAFERADYGFAEQQLRQFIGLYPTNPLAPRASVLLGDTLLKQRQFDEAAQVLVAGFEDYPNSEQAPSLLLRLGMALAGAGERETACRTYVEVLRRYPNEPSSFMQQVRLEQRDAQC